MSLVISGRDLVASAETIKSAGAVTMADPNFAQTAGEKRAAIQAILKQLSAQDAAANRGSAAGGLLPKVSLLPGTAAEAAAIQTNVERLAFAPKAYVYKQGQALESIAKRFYRPTVCVFATHGFFLPDQESRESVAELSATSTDTRAVPCSTQRCCKHGIRVSGEYPSNDVADATLSCGGVGGSEEARLMEARSKPLRRTFKRCYQRCRLAEHVLALAYEQVCPTTRRAATVRSANDNVRDEPRIAIRRA